MLCKVSSIKYNSISLAEIFMSFLDFYILLEPVKHIRLKPVKTSIDVLLNKYTYDFFNVMPILIKQLIYNVNIAMRHKGF